MEPTHNDGLAIEKLESVRSRGYFRTIDLFAGCGGLTLGFDRAGFKCVSAVEIDRDAQMSHSRNFRPLAPTEGYESYSDIAATAPELAVGHISPLVPSPENSIDVVVGGPPCQAFSRLGRAALWRLAGEDFAHADDERASMYLHFLHYVAALKPIAFVLENVREIGKFVGRNIAEEIALTADDLGYEVRYALLNASWYGVPQFRERMFIVGIHKELGLEPSYPRIQFESEIPGGYSTSRAGAGHAQVLMPDDHFVDHATKSGRTKLATTASQAFADFPEIHHHLDGRLGKGRPRDPYEMTDYVPDRDNWFTGEMKKWPKFTSNGRFSGHVIRYTPRDYEIFRRMEEGDEYPAALTVAESIFEERLGQIEADTGNRPAEGSPTWLEIRKATVPPYKVNRYPNKFSKMYADRPARTVAAHIGKDSYSHIHFDSDQARAISLREAARLQSFPDGFVLEGSMNSQLRQIGNAVPPLLSYAVARQLRRQLLGGLGDRK